MNKKTFQTLYSVEGNYWWFYGQRFLIKSFLEKYYNPNKNYNLNLKILDAGCGTGINMQMLSDFGTPYGIDISDDAIKFCKMRKIKNVKKSNIMKINFKADTFDAVTIFGVLYHKEVTDEAKALSEIFRVLKPGGRVFIFDAANKSLFGNHMEAFEGARRYNKLEMKTLLLKEGFKIEKLTYATALFFPLVWARRKLSAILNLAPKPDVSEKFNPLANSLLKFIYLMELRSINYINHPFGVNIFAVARKPTTK